MTGSEEPERGTGANKIRVFVSYDREHDGDLYDQLSGQAAESASRFDISARSVERSSTDLWDEKLRGTIRDADQVIVLCSEHTDGSDRMGTELRLAQQEERPYLLLWGRRELMCTKPATAKPSDTLFSWTREILQTQLLTLRRTAEASRRAGERQRAKAGRDGPDGGSP